jgi:predicted RND superfamily exporter protein
MKFHEFLIAFSKKYRAFIIACVIIIVAASFFVIFSSKLESDVTRLIPMHGEKTSLYFKTMEKFGSMEDLYVIFSAPDIRSHFSEIDKIGSQIESTRLVKKVEWKITDNKKEFLKNIFARKAALFLEQNEIDELISKLTESGIKKELNKTKQRLILPGGQGMLARFDPLNLTDIFSAHIKFSDMPFDMSSGYYLTPDAGSVIMRITPEGSARDVTFSKNLIQNINSIIKENSSPTLKADITGNNAIVLYEASVMKSEILKNIVSSLAAIILIFLFFFRSVKVLFYAILPVAASITVTMGFMVIVLGSLTEVTGAFAALLIGLGVDLGVVLYVRYISDISDGVAHEDALKQSIKYTWAGITAGVLTTAFTFYPMFFSSFRGIRELGILTGTGIILTWVFLFAILPLVIRPVKISGHQLFITKFMKGSHDRPLIVIAVTVLITAVLIPFVPSVQLQGNIAELGTRDNPYRAALEDLQKKYIKENGFIITGYAATTEETADISSLVTTALKGSVENIFSLNNLLPPASRQQENINKLRSVDSDNVVKIFKQNARELGFNVSMFDEYLINLKKLLSNRDEIKFSDLAPMSDVLDKLIRKDQDGYRFLITGNLRKDVSPSEIGSIISQIKSANPLLSKSGLSYTGPSYVREELLDILKRDIIIVTLIGLVLVNIILFLDFRKLFYVFLCQIPVFISIIWVLGIMGIFKIGLNFMNATMFVMLFGIGTDYTIHLLHRYNQGKDIEAISRQTGRAVIVAGLTTVAGFGSLAFSSYRGLASMGLVAGLGVTFCLLISLSLSLSLIKLYNK